MPHIPTAICCQCLVAMRRDKNGVLVEMMAKDGHGALNSYYKIASDRLECPRCHIKILAEFSERPFAEHWQDKYEERRPCDVQATLE